jgi:hypothetical protein
LRGAFIGTADVKRLAVLAIGVADRTGGGFDVAKEPGGARIIGVRGEPQVAGVTDRSLDQLAQATGMDLFVTGRAFDLAPVVGVPLPGDHAMERILDAEAVDIHQECRNREFAGGKRAAQDDMTDAGIE